MRTATILGAFALAACSGDNAMDSMVFEVACSVDDVTGSVPGVSITIESGSCLYARGDNATFRYRVTTTSEVPAIDIPDSTSCSCDHRGPRIDSWVSWTIGGMSNSGANQQYCLCDTGCCAPQDATTVTPETGTIEDTIEWSGRVWQGPSDTGNEPGDFFATGSYGVTVTFYGYSYGNVTATLPITIVQ